jgi:archaemetzincin
VQANVFIHPFGEIGGDLLEAVRAAVAGRFGVGAALGRRQPVPPRAYSVERGQYRSTEFLRRLTTLSRGGGRARLGVTDVDLFVPDLNFVFGEASAPSRAAVFSVARLDPRFYGGPEDEEILLRRAVTEAVHELGHVFGLGHCSRPRCVMWFSNTLAETDRKGSEFCPRCAGELGLSPSGR